MRAKRWHLETSGTYPSALHRSYSQTPKARTQKNERIRVISPQWCEAHQGTAMRSTAMSLAVSKTLPPQRSGSEELREIKQYTPRRWSLASQRNWARHGWETGLVPSQAQVPQKWKHIEKCLLDVVRQHARIDCAQQKNVREAQNGDTRNGTDFEIHRSGYPNFSYKFPKAQKSSAFNYTRCNLAPGLSGRQARPFKARTSNSEGCKFLRSV